MSTVQNSNTEQNNNNERNIFQEEDHRGRKVWVVSKLWPDGTRFRRRVGRGGTRPPAIAAHILSDINTAIWNETWPAKKQELAKKGVKKPSTVHTVASFAELYNEKYVPTLTTNFTTLALKPIMRLVGGRDLKAFTRRDAEEYRDLRVKEVEKTTVNKELMVMSGMFTYALENGYVDRHPTRDARKNRIIFKVKPQVRRVLTPAEVRLIIEKTLEVDQIVGTYIAILAATGLRKREGLHLKRYFFNTQDRELVIEASKNFSPRPRPIPLTAYACQLYSELPWIFGNDHVFVRTETGKRLLSVDGAFQAGKRAAGILWPELHDLRRYRITQWLRDGVNLDVVRDWVGHSNIAMTAKYLIYVHSVATDQARAAEQAELRQIGHKPEQPVGQQMGDTEMALSVSSN